MDKNPRRRPKWHKVLLAMCLLVCNLGCAGAGPVVIYLLVSAGTVALTSAAVRATEIVLDKLLGHEKQANFTVDPNDPSRGTFETLKFTPAGGGSPVILVNVPAVLDNGNWKIDPAFLPKIEAGLKQSQ